jgi:hypothetical protein
LDRKIKGIGYRECVDRDDFPERQLQKSSRKKKGRVLNVSSFCKV